MSDSSYPSIRESIEAVAKLWVDWNKGEIEGDEVLFEMDRKGYFVEAISNAWAKDQDLDYEEVLQAWLEKLPSSPTKVKEEVV